MSLQKVEQGKKVQGKSTLLQLSAITSSPKVVRAQRDCTRKEKVSVVTGTVDNVMRDKELQIQQLTNKCRTLQTAYDNLVSEHEVLQFELDEQKAQLDTLKVNIISHACFYTYYYYYYTLKVNTITCFYVITNINTITCIVLYNHMHMCNRMISYNRIDFCVITCFHLILYFIL